MNFNDTFDPVQLKAAKIEMEILLQKPEEDMLAEMYLLSGYNPHGPVRITEMLTFSTLLLKLSKKAEEQTKVIKHLTYALVFLTITLIGVDVYQYCKLEIQSNSAANEYNRKMDSLINAVKMIPMKQNISDNKKDK